MGKDQSSPIAVSRGGVVRGALLAALLLSLAFAASAQAAPETTIDTGPSDGSTIATSTPTFTFHSDPLGATFECKIDSGPFAPCSGSGTHTTAPLTDGLHTFQVQATDSVPETDPTPASRTFTVDTTPPITTIDTGPGNGSTIADSTPTFGFSSNEPGSTFECRVDSDSFGPCSGPGATHTTTTLGEGSHTFRVRATDPVGNVDPTVASRTFTVDTVPPNTSITSGPSNGSTIADSTPTFGFSSGDTGATFECKIDSDAFAPCSGSGTHTTALLTDGSHTFRVRAVDSAGNPDPNPASRTFTVDTTPPSTTIGSGPSNGSTIADSTPTFGFSSGDPQATFQCRIDAGAFAACSGPGDTHTTAALADGSHTFEVRAVDSAGNPDPSPASRTFTVDTTAPDTTIDSGPNGPTSDNTATFAFSSGDAGATFECRVDGGAFGSCSGPGDTHTTAALADGQHTFRVRAIDSTSNPDPSPAVRTFTVDTTAPGTTIDSGPDGPTSDSTPTFDFSSGESGASFECKVDDDPFAACSGPGDSHTTSAPLADGPHTFRVRAVDSAANPDPSPASRSFTVDTAAPDTTITKHPKSTIKTKKKKVKVGVTFDSETGVTYACKLDNTKYKRCTSPFTVEAKASGKGKQHTISIRATDEAGNAADPVVVRFEVLRTPKLRAPVARRTVVNALKRHGFALRVVRSLDVNCHRSSRSTFACRFSAHFPGYRLTGGGKVRLGTHLSYAFRVTAQGVHLTLTDDNEGHRGVVPGPAAGPQP